MRTLRNIFVTIVTAAMIVPLPLAALALPEGRALSGDVTITSGVTRTEDSTESNITVLSSSGTASTTLASVSGFAAGDYVLVMQMVGTGAGNYEIRKVRQVTGVSLFFFQNLTSSYQSTGAQVLKLSEYHNVTINAGGSWTASAWNGTKGGVLAALLTGTFTQNAFGTTTVATLGFSGGSSESNTALDAFQGNSPTGSGARSIAANGSGGGGGKDNCGGPSAVGGGGGGYGTAGGDGGTSVCSGAVGAGGATGGGVTLASGNLFLGSGGGGGDCVSASCTGTTGGTGGGSILLIAGNSISAAAGSMVATGGSTGGCTASGGASGGGGSGGGIRLAAKNSVALGASIVTASGGSAGSSGPCGVTGGSGGSGRIATLSSATVTGTASPSIDTSSTDTTRNLDGESITIGLGSNI